MIMYELKPGEKFVIRKTIREPTCLITKKDLYAYHEELLACIRNLYKQGKLSEEDYVTLSEHVILSPILWTSETRGTKTRLKELRDIDEAL